MIWRVVLFGFILTGLLTAGFWTFFESQSHRRERFLTKCDDAGFTAKQCKFFQMGADAP
jgi:hypothetical protein